VLSLERLKPTLPLCALPAPHLTVNTSDRSPRGRAASPTTRGS
jgi:hypothetical protein